MKSKLEELTEKEIEAITRKVKKKNNIPLLISPSSGIPLDEELNTKINILSKAQGVPAQQFIIMLLKEDIERLWKVYQVS